MARTTSATSAARKPSRWRSAPKPSSTPSAPMSAGPRARETECSSIADATGGRAFFPFQIRDVANDFAEIQNELRSQYAISYKPADLRKDGHYRTIEIVAHDRKNFHVRARRGYYAPTVQ